MSSNESTKIPFRANASFTLTVDEVEASPKSNELIAFTNDTDQPRVLPTDLYNFRNAKLMVFDANGKLIEAGGELLANKDGTFGSPQTSVTIPAGGFMIGFGWEADYRLQQCYNTAFEGAMLYNATMSIIYDVSGSFDPETKQLSISYPAWAEVPKNAAKFLFVGNSCTYFNGTPLKFKALCRAANIPVAVTYCTFGSAYLHEFADKTHERGKALREHLQDTKFDYVVLQDAGRAEQADTEAALEIILPLIEENGARPLLYMGYPFSKNEAERPAEAIRLYDKHVAIAEKYGLKLAPVAAAYYYNQMEKTGINLHADDRAHHSAAGSYLIACMWLKAFLDVSPVGNAYTAELPEDVVKTLQELAERSCDTPFSPDREQASAMLEDARKAAEAAAKKTAEEVAEAAAESGADVSSEPDADAAAETTDDKPARTTAGAPLSLKKAEQTLRDLLPKDKKSLLLAAGAAAGAVVGAFLIGRRKKK